MMKLKRLLLSAIMAGPLLSAWAQTESAYMELTDIYDDKYQVELHGGMTVYLPQSDWNENGALRSYLVVCDEQGEPCFSFPMYELSSIRYLNVKDDGASSLVVPTLPEGDNVNLLTWQVRGQNYMLPVPGEWTFDKDLKTQTIRTATGEVCIIPIGSTDYIHRRDIIEGINGYLPRFLGDDALVYQWAFYNGSTSATDYMGMNFYAFFPEEQGQNYSLLIPTDEAMKHYVDVPSFKSQKSRMLHFYYRDASFPISYNMYAYNNQTGEVGQLYNLERMTNGEITNRLVAILCSHTILHNRPEDLALGLQSGNEYFQTMDGNVVRVVKNEAGELIGFQGTYQIENEQRGLNQSIIASTNKDAVAPFSLVQANITKSQRKSNGWMYQLDGVLVPTSQSVYSLLTADGTYPSENPYGRFMELCMTDEEVIRACGLVDERNLTASQQRAELKKYQIFVSDNGPDYNLSFVENNSFTIYVPTNEAIEAEIARGTLPTWDEIRKDYNACAKDAEYECLTNAADSLRLQEKCLRLTNFVKAHIHFGLEVADQLPFTRSHNTVVVKPKTLVTPKLTVKGMGKGRMTVTDETGTTRNIVDERKNIFVQDISCSSTPAGKNTMNGITVDGHATGVIHQIDGVLSYKNN